MVGGGAAAAGTPKPRIVIIGAGMAGLSAAYHMRAACFDVTLLEASPRIGGRIQTSTFDGDRVELGATWIHGIEGSPLFDLANLIAASHNDNSENPPWERQDGFPPPPLFKAEGGLSVSPSLIRPVMQLYDHTLCRIRDRATAASTKLANGDVSIGDYVRQQWSAYITCGDSAASGWSVRSLQEAALDSKEYMERIATSANSLYDLDLLSEKEYEEYPGEHVTIARGYESLVEELSRCLPPTTAILFGKKAVKILWEKSPVVEIQSEDGSSFFADHLIITVSLGVLKAACTTTTTSITTNNNNNNSNNPLSDNKAICRSVHELPSLKPVKIDPWQLFEPQLPLSKLESISRLGFGVVDKLFLLLDPSSPYGDELRHNHWQLLYKKQQGKESVNGSTAVPWWMRKTFSISPIYNGSNVALCWFAGEEAMELESLSDEEIIEGVFNTLKEFGLIRATSAKSSDGTGEAAVEMCSANELIKGVVRSSWARNLLFQGSYSYVATGANGLDIEALAEPLPKSSSKTAEEEEDSRSPFPLQVLFAGEATERNFYSTTHGAFLSGKREALRLLNHYGLAM